jgi:hypothetical protein
MPLSMFSMDYEGYGHGRGYGNTGTVAHFQYAGIKPGATAWASVSEWDPINKVPVLGDAYLTVQQVVGAYADGVVDVSVWIDNVPDNINWRCQLFVTQEMP